MGTDPVVVSREPYLAPQVVIVDGQPGCGKTMLSTIVATLQRVEILNYAYELEYVCALRHLDKLSADAAAALTRLFTDLKLYNTMMSREVNFRPADLSGVFHDARPWRYVKRLFEEGDRAVPEKVKKENPILHLTTHNLLPFSDPVFAGLGERLTFIELVRHPLYMIKQQADNMRKILADVRDFTVYFQYQGRELPYYAYGWEERMLKGSEFDKAIYSMDELYKRSEAAKKRAREKYNARIITIPFECYVLEPWGYMRQIEEMLNTKVNPLTRRVMKKQRVPREMYADGIDAKVYRRYGWQPPVSRDENEEFRLRRRYAQEKSGVEALKVLEALCEEYEKHYLTREDKKSNDFCG